MIGTGAVLVEAKRQGLRPRRTTTITHCLGMDGQHASQQHIGSLLDCAETCQTNANFVLRGSAFHARTCSVCAKICARCAEECAAMGDDPMIQQCAEACRRCAESCRRIAAMA